MLSDTEVVEIKEATFRLMERTGCRIYSPEALELFKKAGREVSVENLVRIPRNITEAALKQHPRKLISIDRPWHSCNGIDREK